MQITKMRMGRLQRKNYLTLELLDMVGISAPTENEIELAEQALGNLSKKIAKEIVNKRDQQHG